MSETKDEKFNLDIRDILTALAYASEGRTNTVKPDLLANHLNKLLQNRFKCLTAQYDQTIARLEDEASGLRQARTILIADRERLQGELAATRADALREASTVQCEFCMAAIHGSIVVEGDKEWSAEPATKIGESFNHIVIDKYGSRNCGLCTASSILALITTSDAAAREDRDRRIRLEEAEWWANNRCFVVTVGGLLAKMGKNRLSELRALTPAAPEAVREEQVCGTANVDISTKEATRHTVSRVANSKELPLLPDSEWNQLTLETQERIRKWFNLAAERLQIILNEPAAREDWIRRIRLEGHIAGLEEAKQIAITEGNTPESEGGNMIRHDACDNVRLFIRVRIDELRAPVLAARAGDANELQYCGTCNVRRYFKNGQCEMCGVTEKEWKRRADAEEQK